ncbi:MAG: hypothetical protein KAR38_08270, partial [Calditrichia bacterium]|nr:hypothetical protein [Calditrichia bacterium]
ILKDLATDPEKRKKFYKNPDAVMDYYGLSKEDKEALKSGKNEVIIEHASKEIEGMLPENGMEPHI